MLDNAALLIPGWPLNQLKYLTSAYINERFDPLYNGVLGNYSVSYTDMSYTSAAYTILIIMLLVT